MGEKKKSEKERLSTKISPPHGCLQCPVDPSLPWSSGVGVPVFQMYHFHTVQAPDIYGMQIPFPQLGVAYVSFPTVCHCENFVSGLALKFPQSAQWIFVQCANSKSSYLSGLDLMPSSFAIYTYLNFLLGWLILCELTS